MPNGNPGSFHKTILRSFLYGFTGFYVVSRQPDLEPLYAHDFLAFVLLSSFGAFCGIFAASFLHELGHFFAARIVGFPVTKIQIGSGKVLGKFNLLNTPCTIHESLSSGAVFYRITSLKQVRLKMAFVTGAAPLVSLILAVLFIGLVLLLWGELSTVSSSYYLLPILTGWTIPCLLFLPGVLLPYHFEFSGIKIETDGLKLLKLPWLSDAEIERKVSAAQKLIKQEINESIHHEPS